MVDWVHLHRLWEKWASNTIGSSGKPLKAALLLNHDQKLPSRYLPVIAEQYGMKMRPDEMRPFLDFVKRDNLQMECFFIGANEYLVTSMHENWFCMRCINTSKPTGEGAIVMKTASFILIAMYDGSISAASQAMAAVDQFVWQLSRRNL
ncbi:uncharacterized protein LOC116261490 [Nymphaea colorata]|nr:uncharacterized protein LOC116261490 [Nymphaea colorata]